MQYGQFILDRWMIGIIQNICNEIGASLTRYSDDWVLEITKGTKSTRIVGYRFDLNNSAASAIAVDKVATYQILDAHDVPAVEHRLVRTKASQSKGWEQGLDEVVVKPLDGTSGHGIARLSSPAEVLPYIEQHPYIAAWAVAPYENIQLERRFIMLDGEVLCQYEKEPVMINNLTMFNLGLGAQALGTIATAEEEALAKASLKTLGLRLAAVDIIKTPECYKILEVNDGFMMENYMRQSETNKEKAQAAYTTIIKALLTR